MTPLFPEGMAMMRVTPVESAIKDLPGVQPFEKLSYYLRKYDTFSVSDCSCHQSRKVLGEGCGHLQLLQLLLFFHAYRNFVPYPGCHPLQFYR